MWIVCITSVRHVLTVNGYGGRQTKENEKSWCFKGWETLVNTFAPIRGSLASLSITVPLTVCVCAYNAVTNTPNRNVRKKVKIRLIRLDFEVRSLLDFCFQIK